MQILLRIVTLVSMFTYEGYYIPKIAQAPTILAIHTVFIFKAPGLSASRRPLSMRHLLPGGYTFLHNHIHFNSKEMEGIELRQSPPTNKSPTTVRIMKSDEKRRDNTTLKRCAIGGTFLPLSGRFEITRDDF
ncbi:hypothetical protein AFLA_008292 [Aspergillus flavus NRRL3357]|nr:hypothetical protein AFLA_008292 [Aspergillus flavus NRRL3357]